MMDNWIFREDGPGIPPRKANWEELNCGHIKFTRIAKVTCGWCGVSGHPTHGCEATEEQRDYLFTHRTELLNGIHPPFDPPENAGERTLAYFESKEHMPPDQIECRRTEVDEELEWVKLAERKALEAKQSAMASSSAETPDTSTPMVVSSTSTEQPVVYPQIPPPGMAYPEWTGPPPPRQFPPFQPRLRSTKYQSPGFYVPTGPMTMPPGMRPRIPYTPGSQLPVTVRVSTPRKNGDQQSAQSGSVAAAAQTPDTSTKPSKRSRARQKKKRAMETTAPVGPASTPTERQTKRHRYVFDKTDTALEFADVQFPDPQDPLCISNYDPLLDSLDTEQMEKEYSNIALKSKSAPKPLSGEIEVTEPTGTFNLIDEPCGRSRLTLYASKAKGATRLWKDFHKLPLKETLTPGAPTKINIQDGMTDEDIIQHVRVCRNRGMIDVDFYREISTLKPSIRRRVFDEIPGSDWYRLQLGEQDGSGEVEMEREIPEATYPEGFHEAYSRLRTLYATYRFEVVEDLLYDLRHTPYQKLMLDMLLKDPELAQMQRSPYTQLIDLYATSALKSTRSLKASDWVTEDKPVSTTRKTILMGELKDTEGLPVIPCENLFGEILEPADNVNTFDVTANIVHHSSMTLYKLNDSCFYRVVAARTKMGKLPLITQFGWITMPQVYNGEDLKGKGYLMKWLRADAQASRYWGGDSQTILDFTQPQVFQFIVGDRVLLRIRVQDQPYDVWDNKGLPGRPTLVGPVFRARHYAECGRHLIRSRVDCSPGIITSIVFDRDGTRAPDERYTGPDAPTNVILINILIPGPTGLAENLEARTLFITPKRDMYNPDLMRAGALAKCFFRPSRNITELEHEQEWNEREAAGWDTDPEVRRQMDEAYDPNEETDVLSDQSLDSEGYPKAPPAPKPKSFKVPEVVKVVLGEEAWETFRTWSSISEDSIAHIPESWKHARDNYSTNDFLALMKVKLSSLLVLNEIRCQQLDVKGVSLIAPATVIQRYPTTLLAVYFPTPKYHPDPNIQKMLTCWPMHVHMPVAVKMQTATEPIGALVDDRQVSQVNASVQSLELCYALRSQIEDHSPNSPCWTKHAHIPSIELVTTDYNSVTEHHIPAGMVVTLVVNARSAMPMVAKIPKEERPEIHVKLEPCFNRTVRIAATKNLTEKALMATLQRPEGGAVIGDQMLKRNSIMGGYPPEESNKNYIVAVLLGIPIKTTPGADKWPTSSKLYSLETESGRKTTLTQHQSIFIRGARELLSDGFTPVRKVIALEGPPGTGKTTIALTIVKESIDHTLDPRGAIIPYRMSKDGKRVPYQDRICLTAPTHAATQSACEQIANLVNMGLAKRSEQIGRRATIYDGSNYRAVLIHPWDNAVKLQNPYADRMSINYYMFRDPDAPPSVRQRRAAVEKNWTDFEQLSEQLLTTPEMPKKERDIKVRRQQAILRLTNKNMVRLYRDVIKEGQFNIVIMTLQQCQSPQTLQADLGITMLISDETGFTPDTATFTNTQIIIICKKNAKQLVLVGDRLQLQAVSHSRNAAGNLYRIDALTRLKEPGMVLQNVFKLNSPESTEDKLCPVLKDATLLPSQVPTYGMIETFRFTDALGYLTSQITYKGKLVSGLSNETQMQRDYCLSALPWPVSGFQAAFLGIRSPEDMVGSSHSNPMQIIGCFALVIPACRLLIACEPDDIVIITPYNGVAAQMEDLLIREYQGELKRPHCHTIDSIQGKQWRFTIILTTRCASLQDLFDCFAEYGIPRPGVSEEEQRYYPDLDHSAIPPMTLSWFIGFLQNLNRVNVSGSRCFGGTLFVGCCATLNMSHPFYQIYRILRANRCVLENGINTWLRIATIRRQFWYDDAGFLRPIAEMQALARATGRQEDVPLEMIDCNNTDIGTWIQAYQRNEQALVASNKEEDVIKPKFHRTFEANVDGKLIPAEIVFPYNDRIHSDYFYYPMVDPEASKQFRREYPNQVLAISHRDIEAEGVGDANEDDEVQDEPVQEQAEQSGSQEGGHSIVEQQSDAVMETETPFVDVTVSQSLESDTIPGVETESMEEEDENIGDETALEPELSGTMSPIEDEQLVLESGDEPGTSGTATASGIDASAELYKFQVPIPTYTDITQVMADNADGFSIGWDKLPIGIICKLRIPDAVLARAAIEKHPQFDAAWMRQIYRKAPHVLKSRLALLNSLLKVDLRRGTGSLEEYNRFCYHVWQHKIHMRAFKRPTSPENFSQELKQQMKDKKEKSQEK